MMKYEKKNYHTTKKATETLGMFFSSNNIIQIAFYWLAWKHQYWAPNELLCGSSQLSACAVCNKVSHVMFIYQFI